MNKYTKANIKAIISIVIIAFLFFMLVVSCVDSNKKSKVIDNQEQAIEAYVVQVTTLSPIEKVEHNVASLKLDAESYAVERDRYQALADDNQSHADQYAHVRERAIWASRCWEQNALLLLNGEEIDECKEDLERFASYNLGK